MYHTTRQQNQHCELETPELYSPDFDRFFPHKFCLSEWMIDEVYPDGFRYKVFSIRDQRIAEIVTIALLEAGDGEAIELNRWDSDLDHFDAASRAIIADLEGWTGAKFIALDLTNVTDFTAFQTELHHAGWHQKAPPQAIQDLACYEMKVA